MLEYTLRTEPIEKPSRLQLAIIEWQRQLVDKARMAHDEAVERERWGGSGPPLMDSAPSGLAPD